VTVRVGVVGVGALGRHHARVYASLPEADLRHVYDTDPDRCRRVAEEYGCRAAGSLEELVGDVDAVSVAVPTVDHARVSCALLASGRDVLVEKPIAPTLDEADAMLKAASDHDRILQVGHIERFNPALDAIRELGVAPRFIEVHRLGSFSPRSLDIDVVLDLMIHDLDIVLSLDGSAVAQVDAVGVPVLTPKVDIANARLRLASGLIANLTASRVSAEKVRKFRIFAPRTYVSMDFGDREARVYRLVDGAAGAPTIDVQSHSGPDEEPLRRQLEGFLEAVRERSPPRVDGPQGRRALEFALTITERIRTQP
jgi:predicted dehydrogenase